MTDDDEQMYPPNEVDRTAMLRFWSAVHVTIDMLPVAVADQLRAALDAGNVSAQVRIADDGEPLLVAILDGAPVLEIPVEALLRGLIPELPMDPNGPHIDEEP